MRKAALLLFTIVFFLFMSGCGSQSQPQVTSTPPTTPATANVPVSLSVTDTPPAGVTVLFFQLDITGAALTTSSSGTVSLLSSTNPIPVNVTQLQTDTAFVGNASVAAGSYNGLDVTFSNPQLTIYNGTGSTIGSGANACANNTVCELQPSGTLSVTLNSNPPFPVTLTASSPLAFILDIHLDTVIQPDLSVNLGVTNGVTISQLPSPPSGQPVPHLGHLTGTIESINTSTTPNGFTLQSGDGRTFTIDVNSSTTYANFPSSSSCTTSAETFSCLATQQVVKVEMSEQTDGTLLASEVDFVQLASQTAVEGNIIRLRTSGGNTQMDLIIQNGPSAPSTLPMGHRVTVTVPTSGVTYAIDSDNFTLPSGLSLSDFASASDLVVGQDVTVVIQGSVTPASGSGSWTPWSGPGPATFTTNSITLEPSQITGSVGTVDVSAMSFTFGTFPNFFVPPSSSTASGPPWSPFNITVLTTSATAFTNLTPDTISGLAANDVVSVQGWLFLSPTQPTCTAGPWCPPATMVAAEAVEGRPGPTPLF